MEMDNIGKEFIETMEKSYIGFTGWEISKIYESGMSLTDIDNMSAEDIKNIIIKLKPSNKISITHYLYTLRKYAKYIGNDELFERINSLKRDDIWNEYAATSNEKDLRRFISHDDFEKWIDNIESMELNGKWYSTLLRTVYEGIYNDDMSVVKNLRASDIHGNVVTLRPDGEESYELEISEELADDLLEMSVFRQWERINPYGNFKIGIKGLEEDSCFKMECRGDNPNFRASYLVAIKRMVNEYLNFNLKPSSIYISGITWRIQLALEEKGMDFDKVFEYRHRKISDNDICRAELERCHYGKPLTNYTQAIKGHLNNFKKSYL